MHRFLAFTALAGALVLAACTTGPEVIIANRSQVVVAASSPAAAVRLATTQCARYDRDTRYQSATDDTHWFTCEKSMGRAKAAKKEQAANSLAEPAWSPPPKEPAAKTPEAPSHAANAKPADKPARKMVKAEEAPQGSYWIQVASRRKRTEAEAALKKIMNKNADVIGDQSFAIVKANIRNAGTFYRSRVGPFASFASARKVCKTLKSRRQDCLVIIR